MLILALTPICSVSWAGHCTALSDLVLVIKDAMILLVIHEALLGLP